jgi:hypothetical protein
MVVFNTLKTVTLLKFYYVRFILLRCNYGSNIHKKAFDFHLTNFIPKNINILRWQLVNWELFVIKKYFFKAKNWS